MARITVEDCLVAENNRFALVQLASKRTKQLLSGSKPLIADTRGNKAVVTALREIASQQVRFMSAEDIRLAEEKAERARELLAAQREAQRVPQFSEARRAADDLFVSESPVSHESNGSSGSHGGGSTDGGTEGSENEM